MEESIDAIERALETLGGPSPWGPDIKASDDFLDRLFKRFYEQANSPGLDSQDRLSSLWLNS